MSVIVIIRKNRQFFKSFADITKNIQLILNLFLFIS